MKISTWCHCTRRVPTKYKDQTKGDKKKAWNTIKKNINKFESDIWATFNKK